MMIENGVKLVAGILLAAVFVTTVPAEVFTATENDTYMWDMSVGFTAGAHHAIEDTIVYNDVENEYLVSDIVEENAPLVSESEPVIEETIENPDNPDPE